LDSLLQFEFDGSIYLVNPKGGEIGERKVYRSLEDIPGTIDYVISTVPAQAASGMVEKCAGKGVKAVTFCTAGFSESGEEEGARLEAELAETSRRTGVRVIGPNCMGIYCPESHVAFQVNFPKESGPVGFLCQSGGNAATLVSQVKWRGVRFSKAVSYGNGCDLNESDFLEYLTTDPSTKIIALYIEGVKDGRRFRQALQQAAREKIVVLFKGGVTEGGARAAASHTGALAGSEVAWDSLCKQLGVIRVRSLEELADTLVTLLFMSLPQGKRVALIGIGGGPSVLISDEFEGRGLEVPLLPREVRDRIREFTPIAGHIFRNPVDYAQNMVKVDDLVRTVGIILQWEGIDSLIGFVSPSRTPSLRTQMFEMADGMLQKSRATSKPIAMVLEPSIVPEEAKVFIHILRKYVSLGLPVYYSYASAASAISLVLNHDERYSGELRAKQQSLLLPGAKK